MKREKQKKLEKAGWTVGSTSDFLDLQPEEEIIVSMKLALASKLKALRQQSHLTQAQLAKQIGSSQSRIAKMETADKSVSFELFIRSLASLGASRSQIGKVIATKRTSQKAASRKMAGKRKKAQTAK
jgi:DNA-binding XRE family transcriptional regulator